MFKNTDCMVLVSEQSASHILVDKPKLYNFIFGALDCDCTRDREEVPADDVEREGYDVDNGLDRGRVDVTVDDVYKMPARECWRSM